MSACCPCNRRGRCVNCRCVKRRSKCSNCIPAKNGSCQNLTNIEVNDRSTKENLSEPSDEEESTGNEANDNSSEGSSSDAYASDLFSNLLPNFNQTPNDTFKWNEEIDSERFRKALDSAYHEVIRWKRNIFMVPSGKVGDSFVREMARMFAAYGESTALEPISLLAAMTMPALLLQRPHQKSKVKDHIRALEKRLELWKKGNLSELLIEGRCIQQRLKFKKRGKDDGEELARSFSKLMRCGKVKSALRLLSKQEGSVLDVCKSKNQHSDDEHSILDELKAKHPPKGPFSKDAITEDLKKTFHPVIFDAIDGEAIQRAAVHTNGAAGPSGIDANGWRRLCTSFKQYSADLCNYHFT